MKMRIIIPCVILATMLFSRCGVYSHYQRPEIFEDDSLMTMTDTIRFDSLSIASLSWRDLFTDSMLQCLIEEGLRNNVDLEMARLRIVEAEAVMQASRLAFLPSASFSLEGSVNSTDGKSSNSLFIGPSASWQMDIFGEFRNAKEAAKASLEYSKAYQRAVQTDIVATIAESYYTLLMLDEQLDISRRTLNTWEENIRTLSALKQAGKTNEASVLQAKANKLRVEGSVFSLEKQIIMQENSLCAFLGSYPRNLKRSKFSEQKFPNSLGAEVPLSLLSQRPDVQQTEYALKEAFYVVNEARSMFYPTLSLSGMFGWKKNGGEGVDNPGVWLFNAIGELVQPLFNKGNNISRLKIAKARQEQALLTFKQSLLDAGVEANNALVSWQIARKRLAVDKKQILHLQAAVWNTRLLMKYGSANYLEVLTAQQNLLQAELTETDDRYEEIRGIINFYKAVGGGVE